MRGTSGSAERASDGGTLRRLRAQAGLTQDQLAELAGVSVRTLRSLEQGGVTRPQAASIHRLASALGLPAADLLAQFAAADAAEGATEIAAERVVRVAVLGPVTIRRGAAPVEVGSAMLRALLCLFAIQPGRTVTTGEIVDVLWGDEPPRSCPELVRTYISQLRQLLEPDRAARSPARLLRHAAGGYRLDLDADHSDAALFEDLAARARRAAADGAAHAAWQLYCEALACWRGAPAAGLDADIAARLREHPALVALSQRRVGAAIDWADLGLGLAHYDRVAMLLHSLSVEEPLHEGLAARLMLALAGGGQQAAALGVFEDVRTRLDEQLGVSPGPDLRAAHLRVLRRQLPITNRSARAAVRPAGDAVGVHALPPAQLPTDTAGFTGREAALHTLDALLLGTPDQDAASAAPVAVISGMGGVGKTALAVRWAHRVRDRFPDGQLYADLRGHDADRSLRPIDALVGFLGALGVPAERIPDDEEQAAALYRSRLAEKKVLVLLDNAANVQQVRALLPAAAGSATVITTRGRLTGLIAREGAAALTLEVLAPAESQALLERILDVRGAAEPTALAELARWCAHLPLALRIAAANLAARPGYRLADYLAKVTAGGDRLTALAVQEDPATAVRTTFASSCAILSAADRRVFRLLGLVPGRDATAPAVAALAGIRSQQAEQTLDRLAERHLALEHTPGRYLLHDLLRVYAAELVDAEEDDASRHAALAGLAEYYRYGAAQAAARLYPHLLYLPATDLEPDPSRFLDGPEALAWLDAERSNLMALTVCLAERGHHEAAWRLDDALTGYFVLRANSVDWQVVADAALRAALAAGDPLARAAAELHLGMAHNLQARFETAADHYTRCAALALEAGWTACGAVALNNLASCHWSRGRVEDAIARLTDALELHRAAGRRAGEAVTLANLGAAHADAGQLAEAIRLYDLALAAHRQIGDRRNEAYTLCMLAAARRDLGEHEQALEPARRALRLAEETGDVRFQIGARSTLATILVRVGDVAQGLAEHEKARQAAAQMGEVRQQAEVLIDLADIRARLGQREEALLAAQDAQSAASRSGFRVLERRARRVLDRAAVNG